MEDFATRYYECNPTLIDKPDAAYAVAFSILLLHTDAHNKNVKQKMDKDTFIKRTKVIEGGEGVAAEILDVIYDNIVSSEFTYADDPRNRPERANSWFSRWMGDSTHDATNTSNALLVDLGPKLEQHMPAENSFNYKLNILKPIPIGAIHFSLLTAKPLCLAGVRSRHGPKSTETLTIRVTKAGLLDRKYDLLQGGKRATTRGWRPFGVILSGSQIIFFSDLSSYQAWLLEEKRQESQPRRNSTVPHSVSSCLTEPEPAIYPATMPSYLRPAQIVSLSHAVCIHDENYKKYPHVFRMIMSDGQHFLLRASSHEDMDDWMLKINYAAALKTTGVVVRPFKRRDKTEDAGFSTEKREERAKEKINELCNQIEDQCLILDRELQLRRNLMVLLPCQRSTKDRLIAYAEMTGKRINDKRIDLQQLECYRDFLEAELAWCSSSGKTQPKNQGSFKSLTNLLIIPSIPSKETTDMERIMRRRSQSNPILPNLNMSLLQLPTINQRGQMSSDTTFIKEEEYDDNISVIIVNDSFIERPDSPHIVQQK
ncbi:unnamed protein product [Rhizopus stolonifer]